MWFNGKSLVFLYDESLPGEYKIKKADFGYRFLLLKRLFAIVLFWVEYCTVFGAE
jgi:hypothetical protein